MALVIAAAGTAFGAQQEPSVAALRARAFEHAYNLDYPEAVATFERALARDPNDSATHRGRALITWLHIIFRRGSITVDQYLGGLSRRDVDMPKPPPEEAATFHRHAARAVELAERRLAEDPNDAGALYDLGAALGLQASYVATVEGRVLGAFRSARRAFDSHERVLARDPGRREAGLIVGTYRYVISKLSRPTRWMAYLAGFGGDGELGIRMIEEVARLPGESQVDAKFALMLLYNREGRFGAALEVIRELQKRFPRNRLLWLEAGATALRAGRAAEAERWLSEGIARLRGDRRPRAFGEEALWYHKRGAARVASRRTAEAADDLSHALALPAHRWVHARTWLERGKLADLAGRRADARQAYERARRMAREGNDPATTAAAASFLRRPYR